MISTPDLRLSMGPLDGTDSSSDHLTPVTGEAIEALAMAGELQINVGLAALLMVAQRHGISWKKIGRGRVLFERAATSVALKGTLDLSLSRRIMRIASDKVATAERLRENGLPSPQQTIVATLSGAKYVGSRMETAFVLKPRHGNNGKGITTGLRCTSDLRGPYRRAAKIHKDVIVEDQIRGFDHRLLVVGGNLVAAAKRLPAGVTGNGESTVRQLIDAVNQDWIRGEKKENFLTKIRIDEDLQYHLSVAHLSLDSIPDAGQFVSLRSVANASKGGSCEDVTDKVHASNRQAAELAARIMGLDVCGVDFISPDISGPYQEVGGGICEVNAGPGIRIHIIPGRRSFDDVLAPILGVYFK